MANLFRV
jgi:hypothetical protein